MKFARLLIPLVLFAAAGVKAQTVQNDLVGLGMEPELAAYLAGILPGGAVLGNDTYLKARNAANSADISVLKVDASDETVLNADTGDGFVFSVGGSTIWTLTSGGALTQNGTNGGSVLLTKSGTGVLYGTNHTDVTSSLGYPSFYSFGSAIVQIRGTNDADSGVAIRLIKSRATDGSADTILQSSDNMPPLVWYGADGASFRAAASIAAVVGTTPGASDMPGTLIFNTSADGGIAPLRRWSIDYNGTIVQDPTYGGDLNFAKAGTGINMGGAITFLEIPNFVIGSKPATCTVGSIAIATDSNDCSAGAGDGALCVCKTTDTWALLANF